MPGTRAGADLCFRSDVNYDELQCTRREWGDCFYRAEPPLGIPRAGAVPGENAGEDDGISWSSAVEWRG
jgi:hypothetical protein